MTMSQSGGIVLPDAPAIPGLTFRWFQGEADFPQMLAVKEGSKEADRIEGVGTLEALVDQYAHLVNCDPFHDTLFVEVEGRLVGYSRVHWFEVADTGRLYSQDGFLLPEWRGKGLGRTLLHHNEGRLREIAAQLPQGQVQFFQVTPWHTQTALVRLLEQSGYAPVRYYLYMVRPDLENIPDCPLPAGLALRPARPEHYRAIWEAFAEAMRDHWGVPEFTEEAYQAWRHSQTQFQPEIWKVAWDVETNQVAGMVLGYILAEQNARFNRRRGWTEYIAVRRPWRKRGLASALIAENLRELKVRGMTEAAMGVDAENLSGALRLYQGLGFQPQPMSAVYRKPLK